MKYVASNKVSILYIKLSLTLFILKWSQCSRETFFLQHPVHAFGGKNFINFPGQLQAPEGSLYYWK